MMTDLERNLVENFYRSCLNKHRVTPSKGAAKNLLFLILCPFIILLRFYKIGMNVFCTRIIQDAINTLKIN